MGPKLTRLRTLTPQQSYRLSVLRNGARLLDSEFFIPKLNIRVGLDPILGLVPGIGDLVSPMFALVILLQARDLGLPRVVQFRMIGNVAIDALFGVIPIAGDLFDIAWKANERNVELLEQHAYEVRPAAIADWIFIVLFVAALGLLAMLPAIVLTWLVVQLF